MKSITELQPRDFVRSNYLFASDFYEIKNWEYNVPSRATIETGYNDAFCMVLVRRGTFDVALPGNGYTLHSGQMVVEKANYEYQLRPASGTCSVLNFTDDFYSELAIESEWRKLFFFKDINTLSLALQSSPEIDYLHHCILQNAMNDKLQMDVLVLNLVSQMMQRFNDRSELKSFSQVQKHHVEMVEQIKEYLYQNFLENISLQELADRAHLTVFHFCRVFKKITSYSPYQYLLGVRLKHAEMLLRDTSLPVMDVCYASGFNHTDHFSTIFRQRYGVSPQQYRK